MKHPDVSTDLIIRPAEPRDCQAAIPLMYSASPEAFEYAFTHGGKEALSFARYAFMAGGSVLGHKTHYVAEYEGQVVGTVALYTAADYRRFTGEILYLMLRFYPLTAWFAVLRNGLDIKRWMTPPSAETLYVANFGVSPTMRGKGVGTQILNFGLEHARAKGKTLYELDVADTNPRGQALYERFGMRMLTEVPSPAPECLPASHRMSMPTVINASKQT